jgi:hypothetical protein
MSALPETVIKYECGCTIARNFDGVKMTRCYLHEAAPELLEALEEMTGRYNKLETFYAERTGTVYDCTNGTITRAQKAIAKAKGD